MRTKLYQKLKLILYIKSILPGLLDDDTYLEDTLTEASPYRASKIRYLFAIIVVHCSPNSVRDLWNQFEEDLCKDHWETARISASDYGMPLTDDIRRKTLSELQRVILKIGGPLLTDLGFTADQFETQQWSPVEQMIHEDVDVRDERMDGDRRKQSLNENQRDIFETITEKVNNENPDDNLVFINADAGTGKTYLLNAILSVIRGQGNVAFGLATTGVASVELKNGQTVHRQLKVPLNLDLTDTPSCSISRQSPLADLIARCKVILIDEATMLNRKAYEAIDRTLRDVLRCDHTFGGKVIVFAGDWKQCLPVVPGASRATIVGSTLQNTTFWPSVTQVSLTTQMRLQEEVPGWREFSGDIGRGVLQTVNFIEHTDFGYTIIAGEDKRTEFIQSVFPDYHLRLGNDFRERVILATTNEIVDKINNQIILESPGNPNYYRKLIMNILID